MVIYGSVWKGNGMKEAEYSSAAERLQPSVLDNRTPVLQETGKLFKRNEDNDGCSNARPVCVAPELALLAVAWCDRGRGEIMQLGGSAPGASLSEVAQRAPRFLRSPRVRAASSRREERQQINIAIKSK